ncbi:hypothetical protein [Synechococcus phage S-H38]|uniref:Uncharacterized protein n=1 Tax=Synechococcus phage S-H38 TaxID=2783673 RepID=A0A873WD08_9CAUD|nr:hypothetical protein PQC14_gp128 [Synechococcus phage S-H38]QPB07933.1 hypothetical protein [Synechococcus phage S-H38]
MTMETIEGRPWLGPDSTYDKQRQNRLADCINDYINDDEVDARRMYEELLREVDDTIEYHQRQLNKAAEFRTLLMGNRPMDLDDYRDRLEHREAYHELQDLFYRTDAELAEVKAKLMKYESTDK